MDCTAGQDQLSHHIPARKWFVSPQDLVSLAFLKVGNLTREIVMGNLTHKIVVVITRTLQDKNAQLVRTLHLLKYHLKLKLQIGLGRL